MYVYSLYFILFSIFILVAWLLLNCLQIALECLFMKILVSKYLLSLYLVSLCLSLHFQLRCTVMHLQKQVILFIYFTLFLYCMNVLFLLLYQFFEAFHLVCFIYYIILLYFIYFIIMLFNLINATSFLWNVLEIEEHIRVSSFFIAIWCILLIIKRHIFQIKTLFFPQSLGTLLNMIIQFFYIVSIVI